VTSRNASLQRKLLTAFAALATISLLVAAVAAYTTYQWQRATAEAQSHYTRSLLLQRVRAGTFQALKEAEDALTSDVEDARADFERALEPAARDFAEWAALADTPAERAEVARTREVHARLISAAREVFLLARSDRAAAARLIDDELDTGDYERFRAITEASVNADRARRREVQSRTAAVRQTAGVMLAVSVLSILSLVLLISAYLSSDLFRPLREVERALRNLSAGDLNTRVTDDRDDELGSVARALNELAESLRRRTATSEPDEHDWRTAPSSATLHRLVASFQATLTQLAGQPGKTELLTEAERLADAISRFTAIAYPLDLHFEEVDVAELIHEAAARYRRQIVERSVSLEIVPEAGIGDILADRLKLREALGEALRNALQALPQSGGRIGIRALSAPAIGCVRIEVADDAPTSSSDLSERAMSGDPSHDLDPRRVGFALARAVAERHGGTLKVFTDPAQGTVVQFTIPSRK